MKTFFKKHSVIIAWFAFLLILLAMTSCDIQKKALKTKTDRTVSEISERSIKRKGDTVTYIIPNIKLKDTTIYTVNREGTTLRTVYNERGQISSIDCFSSLIEVTERTNKLIEEVIKDKNREKTEEFDSSVILYGFLGLGLIVLIVGFFGFRYLKTLPGV
jgi:hypothetical protein